jgi:hypothetical protein
VVFGGLGYRSGVSGLVHERNEPFRNLIASSVEDAHGVQEQDFRHRIALTGRTGNPI